MSRVIDWAAGGIGGTVGTVLAAVSVDYNYPPPVDYTGMALLITAAGGAIAIIGTQIIGLIKQRQTHDLVNSMSTDKLREAKEAAFAEGKLAGALEERAARVSAVESQRPQVPIPKG